MITVFLAILTLLIYLLQPSLGLNTFRKVLGISLFLQLFYIVGHYLAEWPFPDPFVFFQIITVVGMGVALGVIFSRIWPISPELGFERIVRTLLISIPAVGIGMGLQLLLQGPQPTQAIYLIFALAAWLGSNHHVREKVMKENEV